MKQCTRCKKLKSRDEFYKHCRMKGGLQSRCISCFAELARLRYEKTVFNLVCETCSKGFTHSQEKATECPDCVEFHKNLELLDNQRLEYYDATCKCGKDFRTRKTYDGLNKYRFCETCRRTIQRGGLQ